MQKSRIFLKVMLGIVCMLCVSNAFAITHVTEEQYYNDWYKSDFVSMSGFSSLHCVEEGSVNNLNQNHRDDACKFFLVNTNYICGNAGTGMSYDTHGFDGLPDCGTMSSACQGYDVMIWDDVVPEPTPIGCANQCDNLCRADNGWEELDEFECAIKQYWRNNTNCVCDKVGTPEIYYEDCQCRYEYYCNSNCDASGNGDDMPECLPCPPNATCNGGNELRNFICSSGYTVAYALNSIRTPTGCCPVLLDKTGLGRYLVDAENDYKCYANGGSSTFSFTDSIGTFYFTEDCEYK